MYMCLYASMRKVVLGNCGTGCTQRTHSKWVWRLVSGFEDWYKLSIPLAECIWEIYTVTQTSAFVLGLCSAYISHIHSSLVYIQYIYTCIYIYTYTCVYVCVCVLHNLQIYAISKLHCAIRNCKIANHFPNGNPISKLCSTFVHS